MKLARDQQKKLNDDARLLRAWKHWHREQLDAALASAHGAAIAELMALLDRLTLSSAAALLACMQRIDWDTVSYDVRFTVLHQINQTIMRLRERNGLAAIDDPLPGQPDNVFRRIKEQLFPRKRKEAAAGPLDDSGS
jgi:hypothetical protein